MNIAARDLSINELRDYYDSNRLVILDKAEELPLFQEIKDKLVKDGWINEDFVPTPRSSLQYVRRELQKIAREISREKTKKICPLCGKEFEGKKNKKICSDACKMRLFRIRQQVRNLKAEGKSEDEIRMVLQNRKPWSKEIFDLETTLRLALEEA